MAQAKTLEFKVDVLWKLVIAGAVAFAGRLSWGAWETSQAQLAKLTEVVQLLDKRLTVLEYVTPYAAQRPSK